MSETTEVQTTAPETTTDALETTAPVVETAKEFKPWKEKAEAPPEHAIPYNRFREVNQERNTYKAKVEEYEAKLAEIEAREAKLSQVKGPDDIKASDFTDPEEFLKARDKALAAKLMSDFESKEAERERNRLVAEQNGKLAATYQKNLSEAFTRNPEIKEASDFLDKVIDSGVKLHPAIAQELMLDENVGELIFDITTNQELLNEMFRGNPADFIRKLHKMSARIDREARYAKKEEEEPIQALESRKQEIAAAIPTQIKGASPAMKKDPSKMSHAEYRKWREAK